MHNTNQALYSIIQCPKCGQYQVTASETSFICKYCQKSTTLRSSKGQLRVKVMAVFGNPQQAAVYIQELKRKLELKNELK